METHAMAYHPSGQQIAIAIATANGYPILIWDVRNKKLIAQLQGHESTVHAVAFSPDGSRLVSGGDDETVRVWDLETKDLLLTLRDRSIGSIAFSADGTRLASASGDKSVLIWETESPSTHYEARRTSTIRRRAVEPLVERLFEEHLLMANVIQLLEDNTSLSRDLREAAIRTARARGDHIEELNELSWKIVRRSGQSVEAYQEALRRAKAVCTIRPIAIHLNTLGIAKYRVGQFEEAIATLGDANRLNKNSYNHASDLLFIAMCHYRLGHFEEANARLVEARKMAQSANSKNATAPTVTLRSVRGNATR
jgi:tetratricopeptide (TPR) repeat protein